jgi:hypothetical protein
MLNRKCNIEGHPVVPIGENNMQRDCKYTGIMNLSQWENDKPSLITLYLGNYNAYFDNEIINCINRNERYTIRKLFFSGTTCVHCIFKVCYVLCI